MINNFVDIWVYEIIVEKFDVILNELGIDKSGDVLDFIINMKDVNYFYF